MRDGCSNFAKSNFWDLSPSARRRQHRLSGSGVTCIIGPNGCGKSNVVDAISWVLGEQSHKMLRAERMSDCIFNGTAKRPPMGISEVSLTLVDPELADAVSKVLGPEPVAAALAEARRSARGRPVEARQKPQAETESAVLSDRIRERARQKTTPKNPASLGKSAERKNPQSLSSRAKWLSAAVSTVPARANISSMAAWRGCAMFRNFSWAWALGRTLRHH